MKLNSATRWIEAAKALSSDSKTSVSCPECDQAKLVVEDIYDESKPSEITERMIYCPICSAKQFILRPKSVRKEESGAEDLFKEKA